MERADESVSDENNRADEGWVRGGDRGVPSGARNTRERQRRPTRERRRGRKRETSMPSGEKSVRMEDDGGKSKGWKGRRGVDQAGGTLRAEK